jgi:hypothetical protein
LVLFQLDEFRSACLDAEKSLSRSYCWAGGLDSAAKRLQNINAINVLLAHQPWMITGRTVKVSLE